MFPFGTPHIHVIYIKYKINGLFLFFCFFVYLLFMLFMLFMFYVLFIFYLFSTHTKKKKTDMLTLDSYRLAKE